MRILIVPGIWPPDVGGPASHAPEAARHLAARGHEVAVLTMADVAPAPRPYPVWWVSRRRPVGVRHVAVTAALARRARGFDVVYGAGGLLGRTAPGALLARVPLVVKLTDDPAYERARRLGLYDGTLDRFAAEGRGGRIAFLRSLRGASLRAARRVVCPSAYLRRIALGWGLAPERVVVVPNAAPEAPALPPRDELRRRLGMRGTTLVFAGRLAPQKRLDDALAAVAAVPRLRLDLVGDGPERARLTAVAEGLGLGDRVRFLGSRPRTDVLEVLHAADAALLPSAWENFPHAAVEALAMGTPVIATAAGGVPEIVRDGVNGLLVPPRRPDALVAALRRVADEPGVLDTLRAGAAPSVAALRPERIYAELESVLSRASATRW